MKKILLLMVLGMLLFLAGCTGVVAYVIRSLSVFLLAVSIGGITLGVTFLIFAYKANRTLEPKAMPVLAPEEEEKKVDQALSHVLKRQGQIVSEWNKTIESSDRLKMLEIASNAHTVENTI